MPPVAPRKRCQRHASTKLERSRLEHILKAMNLMYDRFRILGMSRRERTQQATWPFDARAKASARRNLGSQCCKGCGLKAPDVYFEVDEREGAVVCTMCGVQNGAAAMGETYAETAAGAHGGARGERAVASPRGSMCMQSSPAAPAQTPTLQRAQKQKLAAIIERINAIPGEVNTIGHGAVRQKVLREVRMAAERIYYASLRHEAICSVPHCDMRIHRYSAHFIAEKCFLYVLQMLSEGDGIVGVSKVQLVQMHTQCAKHRAFARPSSVQYEACLATIATIDTNETIATQPCQRPSVGSAVCPPSLSVAQLQDKREPVHKDAHPQRQRHEPTQAPFIGKVRDAIAALACAHEYSSTTCNVAIAALLDSTFVSKMDSIVSRRCGPSGWAYVLLRSAARPDASLADNHASSSAIVCGRPRQKVERQLGLSQVDVPLIVKMVKHALPTGSNAADPGCFY